MKLQTRSGKAVHPIGIGTWNISSHRDAAKATSNYKGVEPVYGNEEIEIAGLRYSFGQGQNHLDCAQLYGGFYTDEVVGRAIAGEDRESLFIADKLWKSSVGAGEARLAVGEMLRKLGTDYLDMLYIHAPWEGVTWQEAIPQIDELIDEGVVRYFGVSNFTVAQMEEAISLAKHPLIANQMNFNVLYQTEVDVTFREFCKSHDIQIVAYQPVKRGEVLNHKVIQSLAHEHRATPAQVALAWLLQMDTLPIPKAIKPEHIKENLGALQLHLTAEDMEQLNRL